MVYKNGGVLAETEKWAYGGKALEVVTCFTRQLVIDSDGRWTSY